MDKLEPKTWAEKQREDAAMGHMKVREVKMAPAVARWEQTQRRLMDEEYKRMQIQLERRAKTQRWEHYKRTGLWPKKDDGDNVDYI